MDRTTILWILVGLGVLVAGYFYYYNPFKRVIPLPLPQGMMGGMGMGYGSSMGPPFHHPVKPPYFMTHPEQGRWNHPIKVLTDGSSYPYVDTMM